MKKLSFALVFVLLFLVGCGTAEIELNKDESGEVTYTLPYDESLYTLKEAENELEKTVVELNEQAGEEVISIKKFKEKDGSLVVSLKFENFVALGDMDDIIHVTVEDMMRYQPDRLEGLVDIKGDKIDLEDKKVKELIFLKVSGLEVEETILQVPGKVKFVSDNVKLHDDKKDTIITDEYSFVVLYEKGTNFNFLGFLIVILLLGVLFFLFKKGIFNKFKSINKQPEIKKIERLEGGSSQDA